MRPLRIADPFDHPDFIFEPKLDGFRALAHVRSHRCELVSAMVTHSSSGHSWPRNLRRPGAVRRARWRNLLPEPGRHEQLQGPAVRTGVALLRRLRSARAGRREDIRSQPLRTRKNALRRIMPWVGSRLRYLDHIERKGVDLFKVACGRDLEGVLGKWADGSYLSDPRTTSWVKIKNPS